MPDFECTNWIDGWPTWLGGAGNEWIHCCIDHDLIEKSIDGDLALAACVAQESPLMAGVMLAGVTMLYPVWKYAQKKRKNNYA